MFFVAIFRVVNTYNSYKHKSCAGTVRPHLGIAWLIPKSRHITTRNVVSGAFTPVRRAILMPRTRGYSGEILIDNGVVVETQLISSVLYSVYRNT